MASFAIEKAIVVGVGPIQQVSASFQKRELVVTIDNDTQYPQTISIEAAQDKCNDQNLNEVRQGDEVTVHINLRGNSWNDPKTGQTRVFNSLQYWKMSINRTTAGNFTQPNQANFVPQGQPQYQQQQYQQPQGQPAQQQQYQQPAPQQQQFAQPNPNYAPPSQAPQYAPPAQQQQTQMQPQPGYTNLPQPSDLPF